MIKLYFLSISSIRNDYNKLFPLLSQERQCKAASYRIEDDRLRCVASGILINKALGNSEVHYSESGKPYITGAPEFNLSHDGEWSVLAVSDSAVGVDIEHCIPRRSNEAAKLIFSRVFSVKERSCFSFGGMTSDMFYLLWTLKESFLKAVGTGIKSNSCIFSSDFSFFSCKVFDDYRLSICTKNKNEAFGAFLVDLDSTAEALLSPITVDFNIIK